MVGLVDPHLATARQPEDGPSVPPLLGNVVGEIDALGLQPAHRGFELVAHELQLMPGWTVGG
jgi:hypothetical protein